MNDKPQPPTRLTVSGGPKVEPHLVQHTPVITDNRPLPIGWTLMVVALVIAVAGFVALALGFTL